MPFWLSWLFRPEPLIPLGYQPKGSGLTPLPPSGGSVIGRVPRFDCLEHPMPLPLGAGADAVIAYQKTVIAELTRQVQFWQGQCTELANRHGGKP